MIQKNLLFRRFILLCVVLLTISTAAQTTLTLQPGPGVANDALIGFYTPLNYQNANFGKSQEFLSKALTVSSSCSIARGLIRFDLSAIPSTATVTSAKLSLYYDPTASNPSHSGSNSSYIKRITSSWVDTLVTWNTQPTTTTLDQTIIPQSTVSTQDYLNIDVTNMVGVMVANPSNNFGMELGLVNETCSKILTFCSGKHTTAAKRPMLVVTYVTLLNINEYSLNKDIKVYPNPNSGEFEIKSEKSELSEINVYNIIGAKVFTKQFMDKNYRIDMRACPKGIYTYELKNSSNQTVSGKLVIE